VSEAYPHRSHTLKTLILQSNTFLTPPFFHWISKVLNTAPLTRLDLIQVHFSRIDSEFWALTIPTLEHLRIITYRIDSEFNFSALNEFLSHHNTISTFAFISPPWGFRYPWDYRLQCISLPCFLKGVLTVSAAIDYEEFLACKEQITYNAMLLSQCTAHKKPVLDTTRIFTDPQRYPGTFLHNNKSKQRHLGEVVL
jgi:hypothetical protein